MSCAAALAVTDELKEQPGSNYSLEDDYEPWQVN
jgi:hypothetical protein